METVLCPGRFVSERPAYSFVQELEDTAGRIAELGHFERARQCYAAAGLPEDWEQVVERVRANHSHKTGFIRGFEESVRGFGARGGSNVPGEGKGTLDASVT